MNPPLLIAGPCSIESLEQLRQVVRQLLSSQLSTLTSQHSTFNFQLSTFNSQLSTLNFQLYIRGGVWKPRSRPGGFEGRGEEALVWMEEVKREFPQVRFCTEVASPEHVELCLRHGVDALWIGSRTTGNPFSVDELCQALRGVQLSVGVKNPMMPDLGLWIGAIERVQKAGIQHVAAIHRGFTPYPNSQFSTLNSQLERFRNDPMWEIPMELRRCLPDLPLLCDPSHIAGRRELVPALMQTAMDLHFDGLMVEVHPHPEEALTDAPQQMTPEGLCEALAQLRLHEEAHPAELAQLRRQIDRVDSQLIDLLASRLSIAKQIAQVKADHNMAVYQPKRWEEVLEQKMAQARQVGLDPQFVKEIYEKIHAESVRVQLSLPEEQPNRNHRTHQ